MGVLPGGARDAEEADIAKECREQEKGPAARAHELAELAQIYEDRGLSAGLARQARPLEPSPTLLLVASMPCPSVWRRAYRCWPSQATACCTLKVAALGPCCPRLRGWQGLEAHSFKGWLSWLESSGHHVAAPVDSSSWRERVLLASIGRSLCFCERTPQSRQAESLCCRLTPHMSQPKQELRMQAVSCGMWPRGAHACMPWGVAGSAVSGGRGGKGSLMQELLCRWQRS